MIEIALLHIIKLLFTALVAETIITFALIIALAKIISKENKPYLCTASEIWPKKQIHLATTFCGLLFSKYIIKYKSKKVKKVGKK